MRARTYGAVLYYIVVSVFIEQLTPPSTNVLTFSQISLYFLPTTTLFSFFSGGSVFLRSPPHTYTLYTGPVGAYRLAAGKTTEQRARIWAGFGSVHTGDRISNISHARSSERAWPAKTPKFYYGASYGADHSEQRSKA